MVLIPVLMLGITPVRAQDCYDYRDTFQEAAPFPLAGPVITLVADQDAAVAAAGTPVSIATIALPVGTVAGEARLALYDVTGRLVRTLLQRAIGQGTHTVPWDGRNEAGKTQASGVYFARLEMGNRAESTKLVLVR